MEDSARGRWRRLAFLAGIGAAVAVAACAAYLLDIVMARSPYRLTAHPIELAAAGLMAIYALARRLAASPSHGDDPLVRWSRRGAAAADAAAGWALRGRRPAFGLAALVLTLLALWFPAYLTWPLWTDQDHFATLALGWDAGKAPWRDMVTYQFPGEIYLFWLVGRVAGWGRPASFYALDAGLLLGLGAATLAWGRRRPIAGLVAYLTFLGVYLDLPFTHAAQRDWHAACFAALGLLAAESIPGRAGRLASAALAAAALSFRPHVVVLVPAFVAALDARARPPGAPWSRTAWPVLEWLLAAAAATALAFAPLALTGLVADFLGSLRHMAESGYASALTPRSFLDDLGRQLAEPRVLILLAANLALAARGETPEVRREARIWALAVAGILLYRPMHPLKHLYLDQPAALIEALALMPPLAWVLARDRLAAPARLVILAVAVAEAVPWWPDLCDPVEALRALPPLARGEEPIPPPLGSRHAYPRPDKHIYHYTWADFRGVVDYLRRETPPTTPVANLLTYFPYPAINATVGRDTPLPIESITLLQWFPHSDFDTVLVAHLERAPVGAIVLWDASPNPDRVPALARTAALIRRDYPIVARIGEIEIHRRNTPPAPSSEPLPRVRLIRHRPR